jgi:hypothetical protein
MQAFRLHHNLKIDIPRFEQGKRASDLCDDGEGTRPLGAANPTGAAGGRRQVLILGQHLNLLVPLDGELLEELAELEGDRLSAFENSFDNLWCEQGEA